MPDEPNIVSHFIRQHPAVVRRVVAVPMASLCISAITAAELLFGAARRPDATRLRRSVQEFLRRVDVLPWDQAVADRYGILRAGMEQAGRILAPLDLLIATHALSAGVILVTNDHAFRHIGGLPQEDWTI